MLLLHTWAFAGVLLGPVELEWQAPAGCASREAVVGEVERLLAGRLPAKAVAVRAEVAVEEAGVAGAVVIDGAAPRTLRAGGCDALAHAVAVVVAVAVDPGLAGRLEEAGAVVVPLPPEPATGQSTSSGSGTSGGQGVTGTGASGAPGPAGASGGQSMPGTGQSGASGEQGVAGTGASGGQSGAQAPAVVVAAPVPAVGKERPPVWHAIGVRGGALIGLSDFPTGGVGLNYSLERGLLRVEARAMYATPRRITYDNVRDGVGARVQAVTFGALGCVSPGNATARVPMCLGAELGPMIGQGIGVANGQTRAALWASGLLTVAVVGRVSKRFNLVVAAEFAVALRRPAFHVGEREVLVRSRAGGARILLGFEIVFGR